MEVSTSADVHPEGHQTSTEAARPGRYAVASGEPGTPGAAPVGRAVPARRDDHPGQHAARAAQRVKVTGDLYHGRVPEGAVYVGRGAPGLPASPYANRHRVGACRRCRVEHDQAAAVTAYAHDLTTQPELVDAIRGELAGVPLACWCRLGAGPCHGDVLTLVAAGADPIEALHTLGIPATPRAATA